MAHVKATSKQQPIVTLKPGTYELIVTDCKESQTKGGHDTFQMVMKTPDPNTYVTDNLVFSEAAAWKVSQFMRGTGARIEEGEDIDITPNDVIGMALVAKVIVEKYNDKNYNKVERYLDPLDPNEKAPTPSSSNNESSF